MEVEDTNFKVKCIWKEKEGGGQTNSTEQEAETLGILGLALLSIPVAYTKETDYL